MEKSETIYTPLLTTIAVAHDPSVRAYCDAFAITPQNIIERRHGILVGFFRLYAEEDPDAAYVANFLTSVLKKEFYISTARTTEDALEAALAKVNIALAEIARQNGTHYGAHLDGAICAFTETTACFSSCGRGSIMLFRDNALHALTASREANDDAAADVFHDIACGAVQENDVFIIASRELATVLPYDDCASACRRYDRSARAQLFRTALINQTDGSCVHIVDIVPSRAGIVRRNAAVDVTEENITIPDNVFSATTFTQKERKRPASQRSQRRATNTSPLPTEKHIYVQGEIDDTTATPIGDIIHEHTLALRLWWRRITTATHTHARTASSMLRSGVRIVGAKARTVIRVIAARGRATTAAATHGTRTLARATRDHGARTARNAAQRITQLRARAYTALRRTPHDEKSRTEGVQLPHEGVHEVTLEPQRDNATTDVPEPQPRETAPETSHAQKPETSTRNTVLEAFLTRTANVPREKSDTPAPLRERLAVLRTRIADNTRASDMARMVLHRITRGVARTYKQCRGACGTLYRYVRTGLPRPRTVMTHARSLSPRDRIIAAGTIALIVIVPWFIVQRTTQDTPPQQEESAAPAQNATPSPAPQPRDSASAAITRVYTIHKDAALVRLVALRGTTYAIAPRSLTAITNATTKKTYTVPRTIDDIVDAVAMDDLNMIILRTRDNAIVSFFPAGSKKFVTNKITFPTGLTIDRMGVYLTYLYLFDSAANDIYRYPRAAGGFGAPTNWLRDGATFAAVRDVVVDGNIYLADADGTLHRFFKNRKQPVPHIAVTPQIHADALYTSDADAPLFILDRAVRRIIAIDKETGTVALNITNDAFATIRDFVVDERITTITARHEDGTVATYRY